MRKKREFERTKEFAKRMKKVHEEVKTVLRKNQEKIRKYTDRKISKPEEYRVDD